MKLSTITKSMLPLVLAMSAVVTGCSSTVGSQDGSGFQEGGTMVALVNLHPDQKRRVLYALNYQLPYLLPMCSSIKIEDIDDDEIEFTYQGVTFTYVWDKHTRKAGQSLEANFKQYFGSSCEQQKANNLSALDQQGIKAGKPKLGMSKEGILFAMGRPPIHATLSLDSNTWTYWSNKWNRQLISFDDKGKVTKIR
ncbi:hypothetical protein [uncultured Paraglaciecola sp.]|uniref:hypothetical protein n=1 Tax=uncultured Paraglaciecola sp. TaxID=1765024 RepID=UPI002613D491|nr:hypothetical protein [uncultured Paraglaciecola sp.]